MRKLLNLFRRKRRYELYRFHNGGRGLQQQSEFFKYVNDNNLKIVGMYVQYHDYSNSHLPREFNYVVEL